MINLEILGNLGKDATVNTVNGKRVVNFSVACTEKWRSGDELKEETIWVECAHWSEKEGVFPYLKKGQQVYLTGSPRVRTWDSNGKTGASLQLTTHKIELVGSRQQAQPTNGSAQPKKEPTETIEDLPF